MTAGGGASVSAAGSASNQTASPLFVDASAGNFHEKGNSPTIDAGVNEAENGGFDLDNNERIQPRAYGCNETSKVTDIGAFEYVPPYVFPPCPPPLGKEVERVQSRPPETKITAVKIKRRLARFVFAASGDGSISFECRIDKRPFRPCSSPKTYKHLKAGKHRFAVRALNEAGADQTPDVRRFHLRQRSAVATRRPGPPNPALPSPKP